eukprot:TRINITY_DN3435_c0_g1_i1.p1 TRINITY_DN3435_c0_g1~~TRINITY_DN3435_c0_g1_i1.p1  ORF type:complete len:897 (+),score=211.91 TRINITY_DN3435_c0_g1_i1:407-3097(+)
MELQSGPNFEFEVKRHIDDDDESKEVMLTRRSSSDEMKPMDSKAGHSRRALVVHTDVNDDVYISDHSPTASPRGKPAPRPVSKRLISHKRNPSPSQGVVVMQPFPERSPTDELLCNLCELGLNWQCFEIDAPSRIFSFPIVSMKYKGKTDPEVSVISFEIRYVSTSQALNRKANSGESPVPSPKNGFARLISGFKSSPKSQSPSAASKSDFIGKPVQHATTDLEESNDTFTVSDDKHKDATVSSPVHASAELPARKKSKILHTSDFEDQFVEDVASGPSAPAHRKWSSDQFVLFGSMHAYKKDGKLKKSVDVPDFVQICKVEDGSHQCVSRIDKTNGTRWEIQFSGSELQDHFESVVKCLMLLNSPELTFSAGMGLAQKEQQLVKSHLKFSCVCLHQGYAEFSANPNFDADFLGAGTFLFDKTVYGYVFSGRLLLFDANYSPASAPFKVIDLSTAHFSELDMPDHHCRSFVTTIDIRVPRHGDARKVDQMLMNPGSANERARWLVALKHAKKSINAHKRNQSWTPEKGIYPIDVTALSLFTASDTLLDQRIFFNLIKEEISPQKVICSTCLPPIEQWQIHLGNAAGFSYANGMTKEVGCAVQAYQDCVSKIWHILQNCLLVCEDGYVKGDENIGFSHPGFDTEVFQVASLSVLSGWSMFSGSGARDSLSDSGWEGCLSANSIAKELMQTLPEISHLYESGQSALAREITNEAVTRQLHNLIIAQFVRYNRIDLFSGKIVKFHWPQAMSAQKRGDRTKEVLKDKEKNTYFFNPSLELLHDNICGRKSTFNDKTVVIWTQLDYLDALRVIHQERLQRLVDLLERLIAEDSENAEYSGDQGDDESEITVDFSLRDKFLKSTIANLDEEKVLLKNVLSVLPQHSRLIEDYHAFCTVNKTD